MINQNIKFEIHAQSSRKLLVGYLTGGGGEYLHEAPPQHFGILFSMKFSISDKKNLGLKILGLKRTYLCKYPYLH